MCASPPIPSRIFVASTVKPETPEKHHCSSFFKQLEYFGATPGLAPPVGVGCREPREFLTFPAPRPFDLQARPAIHPSTQSRWGSPSLIHYFSFSNYRPLQARKQPSRRSRTHLPQVLKQAEELAHLHGLQKPWRLQGSRTRNPRQRGGRTRLRKEPSAPP